MYNLANIQCFVRAAITSKVIMFNFLTHYEILQNVVIDVLIYVKKQSRASITTVCILYEESTVYQSII